MKEHIYCGLGRVDYVPTSNNVTTIFVKAHLRKQFKFLRDADRILLFDVANRISFTGVS